jgi:hypothetical protein
MDTINNLLSALNIRKSTDYDIIFELNNNEETNDNSDTEYYNFKIKNNVEIKSKIDKFNELVSIKYDLNTKCNGCNLSLLECLNTLNYLLNRKEILNSIENSNRFSLNNFKQIIESLFSRIMIIHLNEYTNNNSLSKNIITKNMVNAKMCEYAIHYYIIFSNTVFMKSFDNFYKALAYRSFHMATNEGCVISWLTFAKLVPDMTNDYCYPKINKNSILYKQINIDYLKGLIIFEKEYELYNKLNH